MRKKLLVNQDSSQTPRTESTSQVSENTLRSLVEATISAIFIYQGEKFVYANKAMEALTGYTPQELLAMDFWEMVHPDDVEWVRARNQARLRGEDVPARDEFKLITKGGQERWVEYTAGTIAYQGQMAIIGTAFDITERKRAEETINKTEFALRQRADELAALHALSLELAAPLDLSTLLDKILQGSVKLLNATGGSLGLCNIEQQEVRVFAEHYAPSEHYRDVIFKYGEGAMGLVAQTGKPLIIDDYRNWPGRAPVYEELQPYSAVLTVPMYLKGDVIGVLQVMEESDIRHFTESDQELLSLFANQAAIAIENTRLFEAERTARERSEALQQASLSLTTSLELSDVLDAILKSVLELLPSANNSHIFLFTPEDGGHLTFGAALWADGRRGNPVAEPRPHGLTNTVAHTAEAIVIPNMQEHSLFAGAPFDWKGAIVGLPLKIGQRVVGVMNVSYSSPRTFSGDELQLLRLLGDQAAIAIENARLFTRAATEQRHLSLLYDLGRELAARLDPVDIYNKAISLTCQALEGLVGQAFIYSPETDCLTLAAIYGLPNSWLDDPAHQIVLRIGEGLGGWVGQHRQPAYIPNVKQDLRWVHFPGVDDDVHSCISAPIIEGDRLLGVLSVLHDKERAFSPDHLTLLQAICREAGLALSNATRYQQVQRQLAEITFIQNLSQTFNRRLELQELLVEVATQLATRLEYPLVEIFLIEGEELLQRAAYGVMATSDRLLLTQGIIGRVARTGLVALVPDVNQDPDYLPAYQQTVSELVVPIFHGSVVVGVINIETNRPGQLTAEDKNLLEMLAGQISIALENAVLYDHLRQHAVGLEHMVSERTAELVELYELSQKIGYTLSTSELLKLLLSHLHNALHSDLVIGGLFLDGQRLLYVETSRPISSPAMNQLHSYWEEVLRGQNLLSSDYVNIPIEVIPADTFQSGDAPLSYIGTLIQAPILIAGDVVGMLIAGCEKEDAFGEAQRRIMDTFANQGAAAIQRVEAKIAAEQKRLEGLVEHLPVGVLLIDSDYHLLMSNPLGKEILSILVTDGNSSSLTHLGKLSVSDLIARQNEPVPIEIVQPGLSKRVIVAQARPASEDSHQWVLTLRDVTQERENLARVQMQDRLATVGQLAAGIAHDFNNIMAAILVYADLLTEDPDIPAESRDRLHIIQQQVQRAASLIRQILDFSRRSVMEQSDLELLPFIKELDKMLRRVLPETIQLELSYRSGSYLVHADPTRLQQAFMNLALNARDAMPEGGLLHFELNRFLLKPGQHPPISEMEPGEWIRIIIKDNGIGIRTDQLPHIFEPFYSTKPVGQGTGLGLAQVYGIIKQHDGFIDVKSQFGHGTTFNIYLPALTDQKIEAAIRESSIQIDGVGKTVLVAEDDYATREALQALLEAHRYTVMTAQNGLEALELLEEGQKKIDLIISDVVMPQMGGVALYKAIQERWPEKKILLVTGHPLDSQNQGMLEKGKIAWLQKPFSAQSFNQTVFNLLQN